MTDDKEKTPEKLYRENPTMRGALEFRFSTPSSPYELNTRIIESGLQGLVADMKLLARAQGIRQDDMHVVRSQDDTGTALRVAHVPHEIAGQLRELSQEAGAPFTEEGRNAGFTLKFKEGAENGTKEAFTEAGASITELRRKIEEALAETKGRAWIDDARRESFIEKVTEIFNRPAMANEITGNAVGLDREELPFLIATGAGRSTAVMGEHYRDETRRPDLSPEKTEDSPAGTGHVAKYLKENSARTNGGNGSGTLGGERRIAASPVQI